VNSVEQTRKQLQDLAVDPEAAPVKSAAAALETKLTEFEEQLYQLKLTGGQDGMRWPGQLLQKLSHLASGLQDSDFAPTTQQVAVNQQFTDSLRRLRAQFTELATRDVPAFNAVLKARRLPAISMAPVKTVSGDLK
jgi:hypothetical protein